IGTYFAKSETSGEALNKNIGLTRAHHLVLSHDINVTKHTHIKTEVYYQHLFNVPVGVDRNSTFSMLNEIDGFATQQLVNKGYGKNYGLELTVERFLHRNFYYLLSASLYESKYKAANGVWYDTRFNTNYATTFTAGKEWELSEKRKKKVIGINTKIMYVGGFRNTPIDLSSSINKGEVVYVESKPFTLQNADYFRIDIRISIKRNFAKSTSTLSLDLQNATNRANIGGQYFDETSLTLKNWYQAGMIPILAYRIEF
ncbi:MAG: TonB-dependent receptor, partial [Bacteroidia bacterium]